MILAGAALILCRFTAAANVTVAGSHCQEVSDNIDVKIDSLLASEREGLPLPGELLYPITDLGGYTFHSANGATRSIVDAEAELPFGKKFIIDVKQAGANAWEPQLLSPANTIDVADGDIILYIFFIRKTEPTQNGEYGQASFRSQRSVSPWTGLGGLSLTIYDNWKKYYMIAEATEDYPAGEMVSTFHLGYKAQKVEIGGCIALNMGSSVDVDSLPLNELFYDGMEEDAGWRATAAAGIELNRKADMSIELLDDSGIPVEGAAITVEMKKHHFGFGSFISDLLIENSSAGDKYREHYLDLFNVGTTPFYMGGNADNWGWYGSSGTARINYPKFAKWFQDNGIPAKGHVLIWPGWQYMPSFFEDLADDPQGLENALNDHLEELVPIGKQYGLCQWDVVNEPYINHDVMDILGEEILAGWYNKVHELDPGPKLILNEYNIIQGGGRADFQENFIRLIRYLKDEGAPLGGIGMQCHFDENLTGIPLVLSTLDRFGELGLPIQITEFDINTRDEEIQADYTRDFYTAVFSHPAAEKIVMWGYYEPVMWKPNGAMVRPDWTYKPNYFVYKDLLFNEWWTSESGITDTNGMYQVRGFKGTYDISVTTADTSFTVEILMAKDTAVTIRGHEVEVTGAVTEKQAGEKMTCIEGFPNPFATSTTIQYGLKKPSPVNLRIFNYSGQLVKEIDRSHATPGIYEVTLDCRDFTPGVYFCLASSDDNGLNNKSLILVKGR